MIATFTEKTISADRVILERRIIEAIEMKYGASIDRPKAFEALAEDIRRVTREPIGVNTLKRLFGLLDEVAPTRATLDIIAAYIGHENWAGMVQALYGTNSSFAEYNGLVAVKKLPAGTFVSIRYAPSREIRMRLDSDRLCEVVYASGGKLRAGDVLDVDTVMLNAPFVVGSVWRDGRPLGPYTGGVVGGVEDIAVGSTY